MTDMHGKVVIITGAAGGLGKALARGFARENCRIFVTDKEQGSLDELIVELSAAGAQISGKPADLANVAQTHEVIRHAAQTCGRIDVLVNAAGISIVKSIWELEESDWDNVLDVNVKGLFFALQEAARHMLAQGGSIVNIASVAGRLPRPSLLHYAASKAAVISITRSAALALAGHKIRVNAIAPGMIDTEMLHTLRSDFDKKLSGTGAGQPDAQSIPLGRIAQPEEIATAALFLASDAAAYITGQTLNVCGGIAMN